MLEQWQIIQLGQRNREDRPNYLFNEKIEQLAQGSMLVKFLFFAGLVSFALLCCELFVFLLLLQPCDHLGIRIHQLHEGMFGQFMATIAINAG